MLSKLSVLAAKRRPELVGNRVAKIFIGVCLALFILYIAFIGVLLGKLVQGEGTVNGFAFITGVLPFILAVDFMMRLGLKQTPEQQVKPFLLLPISKYAVTDFFLIQDILSAYNLIWQALFIPYSVLAIYPDYGLVPMLLTLLALQVVMIINGQWYQLVRTLTSGNVFWWTLPAAIVCLAAIPLFSGESFNIISFLQFYAGCGNWLYDNNTILWIALAALLVILFVVNVVVMHRVVRNEMENATGTPRSHVVGLSFINSKDDVALFVRLEIASIIRNKRLRKTLTGSMFFSLVLSCIISFSHLFDATASMWLYYCSVTLTCSFAINIMCKEGNYIDCLMVHKDSVTALLTAKFRLFIVAQIVQFAIFVPAIIMGIFSFEKVLAFMLLGCGLVNFICFQLAVYNNNTQSMNTKITGKGTSGNKYLQVLVLLLVLAVPSSLIAGLDSLVGESACNVIISIIGLVFIITSRYWIRNIVNRMKVRKYANLDSFRITRLS